MTITDTEAQVWPSFTLSGKISSALSSTSAFQSYWQLTGKIISSYHQLVEMYQKNVCTHVLIYKISSLTPAQLLNQWWTPAGSGDRCHPAGTSSPGRAVGGTSPVGHIHCEWMENQSTLWSHLQQATSHKWLATSGLKANSRWFTVMPSGHSLWTDTWQTQINQILTIVELCPTH